MVAAIVVGAALGVSGALFQNVTRNPLGSPDIIGFTTGAATGALVQIIVTGGDTRAVAVGALVGGLATAVAVQLLVRPHGPTGQRLVLVGIGVGATLAAVNTLLVLRASLVAAQTAGQWLAGSLNTMLWPRVVLVSVAVVALLLLAIPLARPLAMLALGDDVARGAGVPVQQVRTASVVVGVAGLGRDRGYRPDRLHRTCRPAGLAAPGGCRDPRPGRLAATGALLVLASDMLAQWVLARPSSRSGSSPASSAAST